MPGLSVRYFNEGIRGSYPGVGHTSLAVKGPVLAAGTLDVDLGGSIARFDHFSGHYQPNSNREVYIRFAFGLHGFNLSSASWNPDWWL